MQVAGLCEVSKRSVSDWESSTSPTAEKLGVLARFGFDVQYICTGVRSSARVSDDPDLAQASARFRSERLRLNLVHSEVVRQTGFTKTEVLDWERGSAIPVSVLKDLGLMGFDLQYLSTGQRDLGDSDPALTPFEWKLLKKVRALGEPHQKQVLAMVEVISAGVPLGGNTTVISGDNKRVAGRDYIDSRGDKPKPRSKKD